MSLTNSLNPRWWGRSGLLATMVCCGLLLAAPASAWVDLSDLGDSDAYGPHGVTEANGDFVMNVGELQINITNFGLIGSHYSSARRYSNAPSAQWPAGSGDEYLWGAGLWVGGVLLGERLVSTGQYETEIRAQLNPEDTIYEAIAGQLVRPPGNDDASGRRFPEPDPNDDEDVDDFGNPRVDEEVLNGYDDDGDGLIDEDFAQIGNQMMVCTMYDNTRLAAEFFPDHTPLNLRIVQEAFAWEADDVDDFVGFQYTVTNIGVSSISDVYIGFFADADIGPRDGTGTASDDMAGSYSGAWRASDGSFVPVEVGFMWDAAEESRLDGYFGIAFLGHDTDPEGLRAPQTVGLRTFQRFSGQAPFDQGGDPVNDSQRYELLSALPEDWDADVMPTREDDFRFLISAGPFATLESGGELQFQVAMAVGSGLPGLLSTCAEAALTWYGNWFNLISDDQRLVSDPTRTVGTGVNGRETLLCRDDFEDPTVFDRLYPDFGDVTCVDEDFLREAGQVVSAENDIFRYLDPQTGTEKTCAMFNMDNCFECFRQKPHSPGETPEQARCSGDDIQRYWNCNNDEINDALKVGCTGVSGNETQVNWLVGMAPPPPGLRIWPTDNSVHVFWDNESEVTPDVRLGAIDFESYRIWRADNWTRPYGSSIENGPGSNLWQLIAEYDVVDSFWVDLEADGQTVSYQLPLGRNTGLDRIRYTPRILSDPRFDGLLEAMQQVADADPEGRYIDLPPLFDVDGDPIEITLPLLTWQGYPAALDTFWAVTARAESVHVDPVSGEEEIVVIGKDAVQFYEYVDYEVHNGFLYFYSVTATDHELEVVPGDPPTFRIVGAGLSGDPSSSFDDGTPATEAQSAADRQASGADIYVYPNPATRESLRELQQFFPSGDDPTGVRVRFANLPAARNTIKIFTLSGDLVETIEHDGTEGYGETSWNLMSRNGQEVVSGIYLYVVESNDDSFDDFIGKFVLVR